MDIKFNKFFIKFRWAFILIFTLIFIANCGKKEEDKKGKIRLTYAIFSEPQFIPLEEELIKDFEGKNPDIKVEARITSYGVHREKIMAGIAGNTAPDLWLTDGVWIMEWAERGVIEELTDFFYSRMDTKEYFGLHALKDPEGRLWGIPKEIETFGLFYNKDIFDRYSIKYPDDSWTWDNLLQVSKILTKDTNRDGRTDIYGFAGGPFIENFIYQNEGSMLDKNRRNSLIDTPVVKEAIKFGFSFYKEKVTPRVNESTSFGNEFEMFRTGSLAMFSGQYCYANTLKHKQPSFNYSVALPPKKISRTCYYVPNAFVITKNRPEAIKEAACKFIEYYSSLEAQKKLGEKGEGLPFNKRAVEYILDTEYAKDHNLKVFVDMVEQSVDFDVNGCWREWMDAFVKEREKGILGMVSVEDMIDNAHRQVQKVLDSYYSGKNY